MLIGGTIGNANFLSLFNADIINFTKDLVKVSGTDLDGKIIPYSGDTNVYSISMNLDGGNKKVLRICFDGYPMYGYHIFMLVLKEGIEVVNKYVSNLS